KVSAAAPVPGSASSEDEGQPDAEGSGQNAEPQLFSYEQYYAEYRRKEAERKARGEGREPGRPRRRRATFRNAFGRDFLPFLIHWRTLRAGVSLATATLFFLLFLRLALLTMPPL